MTAVTDPLEIAKSITKFLINPHWHAGLRHSFWARFSFRCQRMQKLLSPCRCQCSFDHPAKSHTNIWQRISTLLNFWARISGNLTAVRTIVIIAAGFWGLFWIPLRALDEIGVSAAWGTVIFYLTPLVLMLPFAFWRWQKIRQGGWMLLAIGFFFGVGMTLYASAYFFTDVVRALLLYYLLPIWGTLLGRIVLGEDITRLRIVAIILGFAGMFVIFGIGEEIPWPRNLGDWMALIAGMMWAMGAVLAKGDETNEAFETTLCFFAWAVVGGLALLMFPQLGDATIPGPDTFRDILPWMVPVAIFLVFPVCVTVIWGSGILSPGHIGILFMSEISVGVIAAQLLTDEPFGLRELAGVLLITAAGLCEAVGHWLAGALPSVASNPGSKR